MADMPIRKLPLLLVNQIAAGEVIERPASVVKELVENSLDAGAKRIEVVVEDGGRELIRVSDDGEGIPPDELSLALAPHATSKLQTPDQLAAIATMGFRGEALASIASVSRMRLTSRATIAGRTAESGAYLQASGDYVGEVTPDACAPGTVVEVRDLFFNTPARRKFMRAGPTEFGHIAELLGRLAMVRPDVSFTLLHNDKKSLEVFATSSRRQRCIDVLGEELDEAMFEFEQEDISPDAVAEDNSRTRRARVWGLAGLPAIARATGKFQYLCLNGRPIRDRTLTHAIKEAYRGLIPPDKQPVAVIFLEIDPRAVDVNVHPAKAEVRFSDSNRWHGLVLAAMRQRLLAGDLTPSVGLPSLDISRESSLSLPLSQNSTPSPQTNAAAFVEYFRRMDPQQKSLVYEEVRREVAGSLSDQSASLTLNQSGMESELVAPALRAQGVLQVHQSYLVTQDDQGLLIVDQHALHERVMFEELRRRVLAPGTALESQRLLMPAVVSASTKRQALIEQLKPLLERIGIEAEPIGKDAVAVHAFPSFLFDRNVDPVEFCEELLDKAEDGQLDQPSVNTDEAVLHEVLDMMACKAAVKAGDAMRPEELAALLAKRDEIERSSNCPHGRPTTIRLTLKDLEKQFRRV